MARIRSKPPTGIQAIFWRLPIWLYHLNLGWIVGERLLLLKHIGRKSGQVREAVLEVVRYDAQTDAYYVCSGFGEQSQWFRNLQVNPDVDIQVGQRKLRVKAEILSPDMCGDEMIRYVKAHPRLADNLIQIIGYDVPDDIEGYRELAERSLPFVGFVPRDTGA